MLRVVAPRAVILASVMILVVTASAGLAWCTGYCDPGVGTPTVGWEPWNHPDPENWGEYGVKGSGFGCWDPDHTTLDCGDHVDTQVAVCHAGGGMVLNCSAFAGAPHGVVGGVGCKDVSTINATVEACKNNKLLPFLKAGATIGPEELLGTKDRPFGMPKTENDHQGEVSFFVRSLCGCDTPWIATPPLTINHMPTIENVSLEPKACGLYDFSFGYQFPQATARSITVEWVLDDGSLETESISCNLGFEGSCPSGGPVELAPPPEARAVRVTAIACNEPDAKDVQEVPVIRDGDENLMCEPVTKDGTPTDEEEEPDDCATNAEDGAPIRLTNGNMTYYESDRLSSPVAALTRRVYDSINSTVGVFGLGWFSIFDSRASQVGTDIYEITLENNSDLYFKSSDGVSFFQVWPGGRSKWSLQGSGQLLMLVSPSGSQKRVYDLQQGGHLVSFEQLPTGELVSIGYDASGYPTTVTGRPATSDAWSWVITTVGGLIDTITTPETVADYTYTGSLLSGVSIASQSWRSYFYGGNQKLEEVRDGVGVAIEKHEYYSDSHPSFPGWAMTSETAEEAITNIEYRVDDSQIVAGRLPRHDLGEYVTRVTRQSGLYSDYYIRPISGRPHQVVQIEGLCPCGAEGDFVLSAFDGLGRLVRQQDARGAITEWGYDADNRVTSIWRGALPDGCDPALDANQCRLESPEMLLATVLDTTGAQSTLNQYLDSAWPNRPTEVCRPSILSSGSNACTTVTYDPNTGLELTHAVSGWIWNHDTDVAEQEQRVTTVSPYAFGEAAVFNPAVEANGIPVTLDYHSEWSTWATLPQPFGRPKEVDGPLLDSPPENVIDVTELVYYPIDQSVPGNLQGKPAASRNPLGEVTFYDGYDHFGNVTRIVDSRGVTTELQHDSLGRLSMKTLKAMVGCNTVVDPLCDQDLSTVFQYNGTTERQVLMTLPGVGNRRAFEYEPDWGRLEVVKRGAPSGAYSERVFYEYAAGQPVSTQLSGPPVTERYQTFDGNAWVDQKVVAYGYDASSRLSSVAYADGSLEEYAYSSSGDLIAIKDALHSEANIYRKYDHRGLNTALKVLFDPNLDFGYAIESYGYDRDGQITSITDPNGNTLSYKHDDFGQVIEISNEISGVDRLSYDRSSRLIRRAAGSGVTEAREYDEIGNIVGIYLTNGVTQSQALEFEYDSGLRVAATAEDLSGRRVVETLQTDRRGLLLKHRREIVDLQRSSEITYGYDEEGNRKWHASACDQVYRILDYGGRPTEVQVRPASPGCTRSTQVVASSIEYLPFGPAKSLVRGSLQESLSYDQRYRLKSQYLSTGSTPLIDRVYSYDEADNLIAVEDRLVPERSVDFGYDEMNRLRSMTRQPSMIRSWDYDRIGNRRYSAELDSGVADETASYSYVAEEAGQQLSSVETAFSGSATVTQTMTYDASGNMLSDGSSLFSFDLQDRLIGQAAAPQGSGEFVSHRLDSRGWRILSRSGQASGLVAEYHLLSDAQPFIEVLSDSSFVEQSRTVNVYLGNGLLARVHGDSVRHVVSDSASFPFAVIDDQSSIIWLADADPFGEIIQLFAGTEDGDPLHRYPGQWRIPQELGSPPTEIYYNSYRWYNPTHGRYIQADPVAMDWGGDHPYVYAKNSPLGFVDKLGLQAVPFLTPPWMPDRSGMDRRSSDSGGCSEYSRYFGGKCCSWWGEKKIDRYPEIAQPMCRSFIDLHQSTAAVCVSYCLVRGEANISGIRDCETRSARRLERHVYCYGLCGFIPLEKRDYPEGAWDIGFRHVLPGWLCRRVSVVFCL